MDKNAVFISIPKCATKTIMEMFEMGINRDSDEEENQNHHIIYENHQRLKVLEIKYNLNNMIVFTFVRNPYDRIKSWFYYHHLDNIELYKNTTLNVWIKDGCKTHWKLQNQTNWEYIKESPLLQYNFIKGTTKVNFIGKMESFEKDCKKIIELLNIKFEKNNIPKKITFNNTIKINSINVPKEEITVENKERIYNMFQKDFEYFGYEK